MEVPEGREVVAAKFDGGGGKKQVRGVEENDNKIIVITQSRRGFLFGAFVVYKCGCGFIIGCVESKLCVASVLRNHALMNLRLAVVVVILEVDHTVILFILKLLNLIFN